MKYGQQARGRAAGLAQWPLPATPDPPALHRRRYLLPRNKDVVETGPFFIFGQKASDLEWRTYRTLRRLGWRDEQIQFQTDVLGGRQPGGQVLDFIVWTYSGPVVIAVNGDYWHGRSLTIKERDRVNAAQVRELWGRQLRYLALYTADLIDEATALRVLLREVGKG